MRELLIGAGAVALLIACSSATSDTPATLGGTGGAAALGTGGAAALGTGGATALGTGGATALGTGGATALGTGGDPLMGTGGAVTPGTGGTPLGSTGGTPLGSTGGTPIGSTGGTPLGSTGGTPIGTTGGTPIGSTGGTPIGSTGGTPIGTTGGTSANTGGLPIIGNTGGTVSEDTGGTDAGDDDDTSTGGTEVAQGDPQAWDVADGAYVTNGDLAGYAWVGTEEDSVGSTISPADLESVAAGDELCVSGTVGGDASYGGTAMLGWNISQTAEGDPETAALSASDSITVTYTNDGGSTLRLQIQNPAGYPNGAWCYELDGDGGTETVSLASFNTECWANSGADFSGDDIEAIIVMVPGGTADIDYDFCVQGITAG